jgi:hypothetical protein
VGQEAIPGVMQKCYSFGGSVVECLHIAMRLVCGANRVVGVIRAVGLISFVGGDYVWSWKLDSLL